MNEENIEKDMTPILLEDLGMRYPTEKSKLRSRYGLYQCQYCGKEWETIINSVKRGLTKSCGCQSDRYRNPHGMRKHRLYNIWRGVKARCYKSSHKYYKDYGGRGIKVCDRWLDVRNFVEDMYPSYQEGLSIDRIDVNGDYEPANCRWTTNSIQIQNTRDLKSNNTSGYRGVSWHKRDKIWGTSITLEGKAIYLGGFETALEAGKAYERYVRLNNLEHNFTPALTEEEIEELNLNKI